VVTVVASEDVEDVGYGYDISARINVVTVQEDFSEDRSSWQVQDLGAGVDTWSISGNQMTQTGGKAGNALLLNQVTTDSNFSMNVDIMYTDTTRDLGFVWCFQDRQNYWLLDQNSTRISKIVNGISTTLVDSDFMTEPCELNTWCEFSVRSSTEGTTVYRTDIELMETSDFCHEGQVGLYAWSSSGGKFDNFRLTRGNGDEVCTGVTYTLHPTGLSGFCNPTHLRRELYRQSQDNVVVTMDLCVEACSADNGCYALNLYLDNPDPSCYSCPHPNIQPWNWQSSRTGSLYLKKDCEKHIEFAQKLVAYDAHSSAHFGQSVAVSGNWIVAGAPQDNEAGSYSGAIYVFDTQMWDYAAKLTAFDASASDYFGYSVAISGSWVVAGAYQDDDHGSASGSAYVFQLTENGKWDFVSKLRAPDGASSDYFGYSVSISGPWIVVGAYYDDDGGSNSGSAYVFQLTSSGTWTYAEKLIAPDDYSSDYFGYSVAISGSWIVVGAYADDDGGSASGSAYVWQRTDSGSWEYGNKIIAPDDYSSDYFGSSVSISGSWLVVGAYNDDDDGSSSGSAYVFQLTSSGSWTYAEKLTAPDAAASDYFGQSVSISGSRIIVGAYQDDDTASNSGSAYVFQLAENGSWEFAEKVASPDAASGDYFGASVGISDSWIVSGAYYDDDVASNSGSVYVFSNSDN
jgi:hypothetical protein